MITILKDHLNILKSRIKEIEEQVSMIEQRKNVIKEVEEFLNNDEVITFFKDKEILKETQVYIDMQKKLRKSPINYNAIIISLYGCYENFIDNILKDYLIKIRDIDPKFQNLNKKIQVKYKNTALEFLSNPQRFNNYKLTFEDVIENLYMCIKEDDCKEMNLDLVLKHPANLKTDKINTLLDEIGIENSIHKIKLSHKFIEYYRDEKDIAEKDIGDIKKEISKKEDNILFSKLNDLVERRNRVSHRWEEEDRISLPEIKNRFIKFIEVFCECIYELLVITYMRKLQQGGKLNQLQKINQLFGNKIMCINGQTSGLKKGDFLLGHNNKNIWYVTEIIGIRVKDNDVDVINQDNIDISLKLTNNVKDNHQFYYINNDKIKCEI